MLIQVKEIFEISPVTTNYLTSCFIYLTFKSQVNTESSNKVT